MKIEKVTIKNFRLFRETLELSFTTSFTSLVGENGTGKTAILEAINIATSFYYAESKIRDDDFNINSQEIAIDLEFDDFYFIQIPDGYQTKRLPCRSLKCTVKHRGRATPGKAFSTPFIVSHTAIPYEYKDCNTLGLDDIHNVPLNVTTENGQYRFGRKSGTDRELSGRLLAISNNLEGFPSVFYFAKNRDRDLSRGYFTTFQRISDELNWRFQKACKGDSTGKQSYVDSWNLLYEYIVTKVDDPKQTKIITPLKKEIERNLGTKFQDFEISTMNIQEPFTHAFFSLRNDDKYISLTKLGSGEVMIITYFLLRLTSELSKEDIIFLIDEPELHLHPQLQFKLFDELKSSKYQHVFSTHSDIFVDLGNWKSIKRFDLSGVYPKRDLLNKRFGRSGNDEKNIEQGLDFIQQNHKDKTVFYRENNELLFSKKCLLVEGPKDKYVLLAISKKMCYDLSKVTFICCGGKSKIQYYEVVCLAFGVDFFVIYDEDGKGKDACIEELKQHTKLYSFKTSLEILLKANNLVDMLDNIYAMNKDDIPRELTEALNKIKGFVDGG